MDYILLKDFFTDYSLPVFIIALVVGALKFFADKYLTGKVNKVVLSYLPFLLCVLCYVAFDMIFVLKQFAITYQSLYAGLLCGSFSAIFCSMIKRISSGKAINANQTVMLIEGILQGVISDNLLTQTAIKLEQIISEDFDSPLISERVNDALKGNANSLYSDDDLTHLTALILQAVKSLKAKNFKP